jgi:hypothetical protein
MDKNNKNTLIWIVNGFLIVALCYKISIVNSDKATLAFIFYYFLLISVNAILGFVFSQDKFSFYKITAFELCLFLPLLYLISNI